MPLILSETVEDTILVLTLNRPELLNATSMETIDHLDELLSAAEAEPSIRCVVLTGAGSKAFCAGNDIHELVEADVEAQTVMALRRKAATWHWATASVPIVAAVNGLCYGYGTILAVTSDLRVGGPQTRIKVTATSYGGANLTWILPQLIGLSHAKDILLTGRVVEGEEAFRMGLLNRFAADEDVLSEALRLAHSIAANPPAGPSKAKRLSHSAQGRDLASRFDEESGLEIGTILAGEVEGTFDSFTERSRARRSSLGA